MKTILLSSMSILMLAFLGVSPGSQLNGPFHGPTFADSTKLQTHATPLSLTEGITTVSTDSSLWGGSKTLQVAQQRYRNRGGRGDWNRPNYNYNNYRGNYGGPRYYGRPAYPYYGGYPRYYGGGGYYRYGGYPYGGGFYGNGFYGGRGVYVYPGGAAFRF